MVVHDETSVTLACAVRPQPGYEWQFDLQVIYALSPVGLVVTCRAVNVDRDPAPFGVGFHPMPRTLQALALVSPDLISEYVSTSSARCRCFFDSTTVRSAYYREDRITTADVASWLGDLMRRGLARSTATRALATLRSLLSFAVADNRVTVNAAAAAKAPTGGSRGARVASSSSMKWWLWPKRAEALMRS